MQVEAFSCSLFLNPQIFSSSTHFSSLFCFSFCSPEPGFFLFLHTYYSCCKDLRICNLPSETDCLFLSTSSIHSPFSNLNRKHRFSPCPVPFNFFLCAISFMPECLNYLTVECLYTVTFCNLQSSASERDISQQIIYDIFCKTEHNCVPVVLCVTKLCTEKTVYHVCTTELINKLLYGIPNQLVFLNFQIIFGSSEEQNSFQVKARFLTKLNE